ncbi:MAG TPA: hypothetical protein VHA12_00685 [Candidatus Nanoarchaeia archaeon]|nr:hypothetical protein [Candidatus Nanoarchaeia archaeon]
MASPTYGGFTILSSPFFVEGVLPFILVFSLVYAVLQKSKVLGEGKNQLDALVSFSVALLTIAFANAVSVIVQLVPVLAVGLVVLLVFMVMWGMAYEPGKFEMHKYVKYAIGILAAIVTAGAVLYYTGSIDTISDYFDTSSDGLWSNILFVVLVAGAIAVVMAFSGKSGGSEEGKK